MCAVDVAGQPEIEVSGSAAAQSALRSSGGSFVSCVPASLATSTTNPSLLPLTVGRDQKTIFAPSGDQAGDCVVIPRCVSCVTGPPPAPTSHRSFLSAKTIRVESGDQ